MNHKGTEGTEGRGKKEESTVGAINYVRIVEVVIQHLLANSFDMINKLDDLTADKRR